MKSVWKYEISSHDEIVSLPVGYEFLTIKGNIKGESFSIYCLVDTEEEKMEDVRFLSVGTGWDIASVVANEIEYLGSLFKPISEHNWHVFRETK